MNGPPVIALAAVTSDLHLPGAAEAVLTEAARVHRERGLLEAVLVGDRTIDPDLSLTGGRNLLREAKVRVKEWAMEAGLSVAAAEEELWRGPQGDSLARQWLGTVERTEALHRYVEGLVREGALPRVLDTGGNDADKERRVKRAAELLGQPGLSLLAVLERSFAFRPLCGVESRLLGGTLALDLPYIDLPYVGDPAPELEGWRRQAIEILAAHRGIERIGIERIVFRAHLNSDPALRREAGCAWYIPLFNEARRLHPQAELIHVCGHSHQLPAPYRLGEVLVIPVGYGKAEGAQRLLLMDYLGRDAWRLLDFDIESGRLVNEQPVRP